MRPEITRPPLDLLACPLCASPLEASADGSLRCAFRAHEWRQRDGVLDFRALDALDNDWSRRLRSMEAWYENLITASTQAEHCWRHDYDALAPLLGALRGVVVDVGGGNGVTRQWLHESVDYIDLDPSVEWLREDWFAVAKSFPALRSPLTFVQGIGEHLPFRSGRVDVVLLLFSINHAADPARVLAEAWRVLRAGGRLIVVAEDIEPRWRDLTRRDYRSGWVPVRRAASDKLAATLRRHPWPVHPEHIGITERQLRSWLRDFEVRERSWLAGWLTLDAVKR